MILAGELLVEQQVDLDDKVVPLWLIVYDQDPDCAYLLSSKEQVLASVEGSLKQRFDNEALGRIWDEIKQALIDKWHTQFMSLSVMHMQLFIHRLEIDRHHPVGKVLLNCYDRLSDDPIGNADILSQLASLFVDQEDLD
jgi:hypothetical protein